MLPTPSTSHVSFDRVYEPAEDSFLLLDTLSSPSETSFLHSRFSNAASPSAPLVVEVGTGSGVVLAFAASNASTIFGRQDLLALGVDINSFACQATAETVRTAIKEQPATAGLFLDAVNADLTTPLRPFSVDVLIFNPPYVPTDALPSLTEHERYNAPGASGRTTFEQDSHLLALSYAGGVDGMETTNRLLGQLPGVLSRRGVAYVLLCRQNRPEEVAEMVRGWGEGWNAEKVGDSGKQGGWEKLVVLRIWWKEGVE